ARGGVDGLVLPRWRRAHPGELDDRPRPSDRVAGMGSFPSVARRDAQSQHFVLLRVDAIYDGRKQLQFAASLEIARRHPPDCRLDDFRLVDRHLVHVGAGDSKRAALRHPWPTRGPPGSAKVSEAETERERPRW